jgi:DNA polymerase I-like protein with 3'-5' exonuclease and polymerase domains
MAKVAIIDKAPSRNDYSKYFDFEFDLYHMSSVPVQKLLKKDIDLEVYLEEYDYVICVGSEASKEYAGVTKVTDYAGQLVREKFICIPNPAVLIFKPEGKAEFDRAVDKVKKYVSGEVKDGVKFGDFKGIDNGDEAYNFLLQALEDEGSVVALDTETTALYPRDGYVLGLCISYKPGQGRYILSDVLEDRHMELIQKIVDTKEIVFHNMKFDYKMIEYHFGIRFRDDHVHDTMVMHYILDENSSHGLKPLAIKYTSYGDYDTELSEFIDNYCRLHSVLRDDFTWDLIPFEIISIYASIDPAATLEIFFKFKPLIDGNAKFKKVYYNILRPGTLFLHRMEEHGIPISKERMIGAEGYLDRTIEEARNLLYTFDEVKQFEKDSGVIFNPNSVQQLRVLLFDYLKLPHPGKRTKTGALSTDAEVLQELEHLHELPRALLNIRQLTKIKNTYVTKILAELDRDGRIRTNFNLIFTTSGRLSSSGKFNAQQIIRDDPIIKGCIVAPKGYKVVSQDLQTGEMYYAAVLSGDKELQKVFIEGGDFHSSIAKMVFNLNCVVEAVKEIFPAMRQSAKAISFGINLQRSR